jgi:thymidine phosphorylase
VPRQNRLLSFSRLRPALENPGGLPVRLTIPQMKKVVEREGGCIVWGGSVNLSPADDILIRVERPLDLHSEGQLVASILSKKLAAGSTHVIIDIPVGATAKIRSPAAGEALGSSLLTVGRSLGLTVQVIFTDGSQPVGRGVGPALEAVDVLAVLRNEINAPQDLKERALLLAGGILELGGAVGKGERNQAGAGGARQRPSAQQVRGDLRGARRHERARPRILFPISWPRPVPA